MMDTFLYCEVCKGPKHLNGRCLQHDAASELIESLKDAMSLCSVVGDFQGNEFYTMSRGHSWSTLLEKVRRVLAQAEGKVTV